MPRSMGRFPGHGVLRGPNPEYWGLRRRGQSESGRLGGVSS